MKNIYNFCLLFIILGLAGCKSLWKKDISKSEAVLDLKSSQVVIAYLFLDESSSKKIEGVDVLYAGILNTKELSLVIEANIIRSKIISEFERKFRIDAQGNFRSRQGFFVYANAKYDHGSMLLELSLYDKNKKCILWESGKTSVKY